MMRSLWTAASGMIAQQTNVDTISNNLANVNTTGYKKETMEFKSLLYQTIQKQSTDSNGDPKPVGVQVGLGVRNSAIVSQFRQGILTSTENTWDFALEGEGFFQVQMPDGTIGYTRAGSLQMAISQNGLALATSEGYKVLDSNGQPIEISGDYQADKIKIDKFGNFSYPDKVTNVPQSMGIKLGLVQFNNPSGLDKVGSSLYKETDASGVPRLEAAGQTLTITKVHQGYVEGSNVQTVDEMVNLIVAQRAYEMNSKAITASDEMLQQANNLKR